MPVFIEEEKRLNEIGRALIYLSLWQSLGAIYLAPDNGVVVSTGFDTEPDNRVILGNYTLRPICKGEEDS
jgi:hypothetical protein